MKIIKMEGNVRKLLNLPEKNKLLYKISLKYPN